LAAGGAPVCFADLAAEPFVGLSAVSALQQHYRREAEALGLKLREQVSVASFDGVRQMVEAGLGVAILPDTAMPRATGAAIAARPLDEPWAARQLSRCVRRDAEALPAAARWLAGHLLGRCFP
jgi:DNA-binding transcriptional LysR family regulator